MNLLFDTNVLVSAFISTGNSFDVIGDAFQKHDIYYTDFVVFEFESVFRDKFHYTENLIGRMVLLIKRRFKKGKNAVDIENVCKDSDDGRILADALINNVDVIVTGDTDLLELKIYKGIKIISPKQYWNLE